MKPVYIIINVWNGISRPDVHASSQASWHNQKKKSPFRIPISTSMLCQSLFSM